jgi:hypothetical protein
VMNQGYDVVLLGSLQPIRVDVDQFASRVTADPRIEVSLKEVGFRSGLDLLGVYAAQTSDLKGWLAGAQINRDVSLRLQFLAGMAVNQGRAGLIYGEIEKRGVFPGDVFVGSASRIAAVRKSFDEWRSDEF